MHKDIFHQGCHFMAGGCE